MTRGGRRQVRIGRIGVGMVMVVTADLFKTLISTAESTMSMVTLSRLVFKSPVLGPQKDCRPNWTTVAVQALW